jgi:hypothetical protein
MQVLAQASPGVFWAGTSLVLLLTVTTFSCAFWLLHRARLIEDTPTSRLRSAAQGYVQMEGHARWMPGSEIISPLSGHRCVWWHYSVEQRATRSGRSEWVTVASGRSDDLFLLVDPTGQCIVDPEGAQVRPSVERVWRGFSQRPTEVPRRSPWLSFGHYRYREKLIVLGDRLFVTGWFRTQSVHSDFDDAREVRELLAEWKRDRHELLRRFDANGDGQIDVHEWETVRRSALEQVRAEQLERASVPDLNVLSQPPTRLPFLLWSASKHALARRLKWVAGASLVASTLGAGLAIRLLQWRGVL